jgi:hypothetical protein
MEEKKNGAPGATRTHDTQIRNLVLYPPELRGHRIFSTITMKKVKPFPSTTGDWASSVRGPSFLSLC